MLVKSETQKDGDKLMPPPAPRKSAPDVPYERTLRYIEEQEEIYKLRMLTIRREEASLMQEKRKLEGERELLTRELKRQRDESASKFSDFPLLHDRYVLLNLLGRGGFSEVFKAFDLRAMSYVACKFINLPRIGRSTRRRIMFVTQQESTQFTRRLSIPGLCN